MGEMRYKELRRLYRESRGMTKEEETRLLLAAWSICKLAAIARKEGLLALEETVVEGEEYRGEDFLRFLVLLVLDGTDPVDIQDMGWRRYCVSLEEGCDALCSLIYLEGALVIQAGDNPRIVEEKMKSFLPKKLYEEFEEMLRGEEKKPAKETTQEMVERVCAGKRLWNPKDKGYFVMKLADYTLCDLGDMQIQRLLRDIDNTQLALVMRGLSGDARRRILDNLSERLARMIMEDMEYMGPVRAMNIVEAAQQILMVILRLHDRGEIVGEYEYLKPFLDMFRVDYENVRTKDLRYDKLKVLLQEYEEAAYDLL